MNTSFKDRDDAAIKLASKLIKYKGKDGIVLAIPRGGVPIGYVIANELNFPMEVLLSKKIGHPSNPEYAVGSVSIHGTVINDNLIDVSNEYIQKESKRILNDLEAKFKLYMGDKKPTNLKNKTVIIVDDGVATGNTIKVAIPFIKKNNPKEIIVAVPVSPKETANRITRLVDEFVCLQIPHDFHGVGQYYDDFSQVTDEEVIDYLKKSLLQLNSH